MKKIRKAQILNLKYQLQHGIKSLHYLINVKITLNISLKKWRKY